jgi:pyruvate ferredoxin oxidoreductase delta subunit
MSKEYIVPVGRDGIYIVDTGKWRVQTPVLDPALCVACGRCRMYCPVGAIHHDPPHYSIHLTYCKGCGICATECGVGAISMNTEEA